MKKISVLGWDSGYDFEKFVVGPGTKERIVFPGVLAMPGYSRLETVTSNKSFNINNMQIDYKNESYYVGDIAIRFDPAGGIRNFNRNRFRDEAEVVKLLAGASLLNSDARHLIIDALVVGLSISCFSEYRNDLISTYKDRSYNFDINGSRKELSIRDVYCVPQGVGASYDLFLDWHGGTSSGSNTTLGGIDISNIIKGGRTYGLLDVGGKTIDAYLASGVDPIPGTDVSFDNGTSAVYIDLSKKTDNLPANIIEDSYINDKSVFWRGRQYNLKDDIDFGFKSLAGRVHNNLVHQWGDHLDRVEFIVLCGGAANTVQSELRTLFGMPVVIASDPQFANALGYFKLGRFIRNNSVKQINHAGDVRA